MESEERRGSGFAAGLVLGAILGAGVAVPLAPKMNGGRGSRAAGPTTSWAARKLPPSTTERIRVSAAEGGLTDLDGALRIIRRLREAGHPAYLVGGAGGGPLLGRP